MWPLEDVELCSHEDPQPLGPEDRGDYYSWYSDQGKTNILALDTHLYWPQTNGTYYMLAEDASTGCASELRAATYTVNESPLLVNPQGYVACNDENYMGLSVEDEGFEYNWYSAPSGGTVHATDQAVFMASGNGTYYVEAVDPSSGCTNGERVAIELLIHNPSQPLIAYDGDSLHTNEASSYQWYRDGIAVFDATDKSYAVPGSGTYYVIVVDENGCESKSDEVVLDFTGGILGVEKVGFTLSPNPSSGLTLLRADVEWVGATIEVRDLQGKLVSKSTLLAPSYSLDVSDWDSGIYFITLITSTSQSTLRLIKP